ncbi:putative RNA-binding protein Luc7-like 2 isoform X1 [Anabrus simplex]|uniref:putative RNA-binding protein Luc7-like 2 isoform X1 n=1 Tax=Anabrus simplex TaxID=316456 RepID=UPI0034DDA952
MTAHDQIRAMLDQLMGTGRNGENNRFQVKFSDPKVCKSFLLSCCPHEILSSTRMDLGECPKIHDLALRADFEKASRTKDYYYDIDAMEHLQAFIADCDRRTELAKQRLAETQEELSAEVALKANKVHELAEQIGKKLARAEQLGAEGLVEDSMKLMEEIEDLRKKKNAAEGEYRNSMPASSYQQQKLRVCEVCSAYLGIHDNDRRLADHFGGKLHLGFIKIREKLAELEKTVEERKQQKRQEMKDRDREREREREERERVRERDRGVSGSHGRSRERERSHRRSRSRSRGRSRSKSHSSRSHRSRSGSRSRRSHSHSHRSRSSEGRKDRSRSRDRKRDGERRHGDDDGDENKND